MARKRKGMDAPEGELEMTPMIDVVFQLLIYFIVTIKPVDVVTNLDVFRPAPEIMPHRRAVPPGKGHHSSQSFFCRWRSVSCGASFRRFLRAGPGN